MTAESLNTENRNTQMLSGPERPIETEDQDALDRHQFVVRLARAVIDKNKRATGVVVGVTGAWGSGKSSVLNLLCNYLNSEHPEAVVVCFDPWLISGRNDLIAEFIGELISATQKNPKIKKSLKILTKTFATYGKHLAPVANVVLPGAGIPIAAGASIIDSATKGRESLNALKSKLSKELEEQAVPIVVLIDELDRVEDHEIRAVAQLVRSVADFRGISYVLAYDPVRVMQALGEGSDSRSREERGRAYLEKIVQLQIPLPFTQRDEFGRLLTAELQRLRGELDLPQEFYKAERYVALSHILILEIFQTLRDVKRFVAMFQVIAGMTRTEVDWIDLLAYCALLLKAPATVDKIRDDPDGIAYDAISRKALMRHRDFSKLPLEQRFQEISPESERNAGTRQLLEFLFPIFSEHPQQRLHADAISSRRPLLTALHLGLAPGQCSRNDIENLVQLKPELIERELRNAYDQDTLDQLIDRLDDLYASLGNIDHVALWKGVAAFVRKPDCEWMTSFVPMSDITYRFSSILERAVLNNDDLRTKAGAVFTNLRNFEEDELTAFWLRHHFFRHGLFGNQEKANYGAFLTREQTEALARDMSIRWKSLHWAGKLIPCRWDLQPVFSMMDMSMWDDKCRQLLDDTLNDNRALDGFTLMMYGQGFSTGRETVEKMCSYDAYLLRVGARLASPTIDDADESVGIALRKAERGGL